MAVLFRFLAHLPLPLLHNLGALAGWLAYLASPTYRRHVRENTAQAGVGGARIGSIAEAGKSIFELPKLWLRPQEEVVARVVRVSGWELVSSAWSDARAILFLTPHLGCFEITAQYYAAQRPITVLYRPPKQAWLRPLVEQGRGAKLKLASADIAGVRLMMKALRRREAAGILPDQVPSLGEGIWAPFFGRPAYTMTLAHRLVQQTGARMLFIWAERLTAGQGYLLRVSPLTEPMPEQASDDVNGSAWQAACAASINREMERLIRQCPGQYLWGYHRFKQPRSSAVDAPGAAA